MTSLPPQLAQATRELAAGQRGLGESAGRISAHYRQRGTSREVIGTTTDVLAYALSRMPATFAAVSVVVEELRARAPDFAPGSVLDAGAGPGTAAWAVAEGYPDIAATLLDHNRGFLEIAASLAGSSAVNSVTTRLGEITRFDLSTGFDLVTCAYALTELGDDDMLRAADALWQHCHGALIVVEPGRPLDYQRLMAVRQRLIGQGGAVLAPCPHDDVCPLVEPDWCHFSVRLNRSREHMRMKGATLGYEDEKFSYLVVARPGIGNRAAARVLRKPEENKFSVTLPLCTSAGREERVVPSRDKSAFKAAKKLDWGDAL